MQVQIIGMDEKREDMKTRDGHDILVRDVLETFARRKYKVVAIEGVVLTLVSEKGVNKQTTYSRNYTFYRHEGERAPGVIYEEENDEISDI